METAKMKTNSAVRRQSKMEALRQIGATLALCAVATAALAVPVTDSAWRSGVHPNLFAYHGIATQAQVTARVQAQYNQLFINGNESSQRLLRAVGSNMAFIEDVNSADIRSEGMSYGMMIAVMMNDQSTFDKLWRFAKQYMRNSNGTFAWHVNRTSPYSKYSDTNPAPDAEEYFAMALFFANNRWTSSEFNYQTEARAVTAVLKSTLFNNNSDGGLQVYFSPAPSARYRFTDPSYHLPAFYELWQQWDVAGNGDFWGGAAYQSRYYQFYGAHPDTGLFSEYSTFYPGITPGPAMSDGGPNNVYGVMTTELATLAGVASAQAAKAPHFFSDAYRVINNIGMDFAWFTACCGDEATSSGISFFGGQESVTAERQLTFMSTRTNLNNSYSSGYQLNGTPLSDVTYKSAAHVAMNAVGTLAFQSSTSDALAKPFVQALWSQNAPEGQFRYYDGMLHMLAMLHVSGQFKIYGPTSAGMFFDQSPSATNQAQISFKLRNSTSQAQSNLKAYYFLTTENGRTPVVEAVSTPNVSSLTMQQLSGSQWAAALTYANVTLQPNKSVTQPDVFRVRYSDGSTFNKSNDFSQPKSGAAESANRIAVVNSSGKLLMGDVPDGVALPAPANYTIRVRARGVTGQEVISLTVGGTQVASWNLTTSFADYSVSTALSGGINVVYANDGGSRDVVVDYAEIGGVVRQAEQQTTNTAAFGNGRCGGGQLTEWMHCNGYIGFLAFK